jgi:hypothetical protein
MAILDMKLFGDVTLLHLIIVLVAFAGLMKVWGLVFKDKTNEGEEHYEAARCACGWSGQVSKYTRKCPVCNNAIIRG